MNFDKIIQYVTLVSLLIATIGFAYIFIITIILKSSRFAGFYDTWQFPMLLAILIDTAFYKHIDKLTR